MDYWLNPTIKGKPLVAKSEVAVPSTREHANNYFLMHPIVPKQQHAVENFVVREQTRQLNHIRQ